MLRFLAALARFRSRWLAAVNGPAVGVGTTMLLHCDLVYAGEDAQFSLPFASLGLCPEAGSSVLLPALAGYARAAEKLLFGEPFDAQEAREMGLVNKVMPAAQVLEFALARAHSLARQPAASLLETKRLLRAPLAAQVAQAMADESATFRRMITEPAAREAFSAFLEKRKPDFSKAEHRAGPATCAERGVSSGRAHMAILSLACCRPCCWPWRSRACGGSGSGDAVVVRRIRRRCRRRPRCAGPPARAGRRRSDAPAGGGDGARR